jgi:hypothetical protein
MKTQYTSYLRRPASVLAAIIPLWLATPTRSLGQEVSPPPVQILQSRGQLADGLIFISPQGGSQPDPAHPLAQGAEILDNQGRPVWFNPVLGGVVRPMDFRVQTYQDKPVLTWTQGASYNVHPTVPTVDYILDTSYNVVATVQAGNGLNAEQHEFTLTPQNTALISVYNLVDADLSSVGGSVNGKVYEGVVQEVDVATGNVLLEWHSLRDVPVTDSYLAAPGATATNQEYDYFHLNSVNVDTDGNLLVSARHTWTVYKINRTTGQLMWRLGGKRSDFALGAGLPFAWQHNAVAVDAKTIRIFDNESNGTPVLPYSRVIWVTHDEATMTASVTRTIVHPDALSSAFMGNGQLLDNGNTFIGWGAPGRFSEFDASGQLLFDAQLGYGYNTYRAYRFKWVGTPTTSPTASVEANNDGTLTVHAIWNGATEVANWTVLGGATPSTLLPLTTVAWNGLDTTAVVAANLGYVQVVARNAAGAEIGTSETVTTPFGAGAPVFLAVPASQTVATGSTLVLTATVDSASNANYQWYRNGTAISGATSARLVIAKAGSADAGKYTVTATNIVGSAISGAATVAIATTGVSRLGNLSVLANADFNTQPLIAGFVVGGAGTSGTTKLLVRATGPALVPFGATNLLPDPMVTLFNGTTTIAANDNWNSPAENGTVVTATGSTVGAFPLIDPNGLDSALVCTVGASDYSAAVTGNSRGSGLALLELYQLPSDAPDAPRLINMSARGTIGGGNVLVSGFVVEGTTSKTVLIRGIGPALRSFGIENTLPDPKLVLHANVNGSDTVLATNTGWNGDPQIQAAGQAAGAFGLSDPADAAMLVTLAPGAYTVEVSSESGATGVALFEIYELP